jgi:hypothetical protein
MMLIIFSPQGIGSFGLASDILGAYLLFKHIRAKALSEYQDLIKNAFRELINLRILKRLDLPTNESEKPIATLEIAIQRG